MLCTKFDIVDPHFFLSDIDSLVNQNPAWILILMDRLNEFADRNLPLPRLQAQWYR